ncbi:ATP-binding protein [Tropicimonas sp. TH_r6]|uniref:ATP-binding protein n=1 Tax=Tropicimonas sp. TH_r6 TaxID=3082085 RepID=UPI002954603C|nr:ATP-binding protein [Tropicimonas sp. TH_r6]
MPLSNADNLDAAFDVLSRLIRSRLNDEEIAPEGSVTLSYFDDGSSLGNFIRDHQPQFVEYVIVMLALLPHVRPTLLDSILRPMLDAPAQMPELGGVRDPDSRTFMPTGQTAAFLLAGHDMDGRFAVHRVFSPSHWFAQKGILQLEPAKPGAPLLSGQISMSPEWIYQLTLGELQPPAFSAEFPAHRLSTQLEWNDLILQPATTEALGHIRAWILHAAELRESWFDAGRFAPGYRALFFGPSGTGKTLAATLLGKFTKRAVYRIDLSAIVSKYIGETEKNLAKVFEIAESRDWILFFDEADALFGKRTNVKDSHDRYANQEVSYLLQRIENCDALCILATNLRSNIDDAFLRRFNSIVQFTEPGPEERMRIWRRAARPQLLPDAVIGKLRDYELTGGAIVNVVQFAAIQAIAAGRDHISLEDAELGIQREVEKEGKVFRRLNS